MDISQLLEGAKSRSSAWPSALQMDSSSLVTAALLQKQAEVDRQRVLISQQLAALQAPPPSSDDLILALLQRQRQLEALRREVRASSAESQALSILGGPSSLTFGSNLVGTRQPAPKLEALADILCARAAKNPADDSAAGPQLNPPQPSVVDATSLLPYRKRKGRTGSFPQKLHEILADLQLQPGGSEIASFLPHGRAFMIHKPREFAQHVLPKYFRMSHYSSFQRQLNLYEFQRVVEGPDKGAYYHKLFVKSQPQLSVMMKRNKIKGIKTSLDDHSNGEEGCHGDGDGDDTAG